MPVRDPVVSVMIVSYNTREMTLDCLRSVKAETKISHEVLVLDNASQDGSAEAIVSAFPDVRLIAEGTNLGFAKANNVVAQMARGEFILLLNPDTVVLDGAIDRLVEFARATPFARIWGGRTVFGDGSLNPTSCWRKLTLWNIFCRTAGLTRLFPASAVFNSEAYGGWDRSTERQVDVVTGCFLLISSSDWDALDGFNLRFVMYGEEVDLCLRATRQLGAAPRVTPTATIVHYGGASQNVRSDKMVRLMRAKTELINEHFPAWTRPVAQGMFRLWPLSRWWAAATTQRIGLRERGQGAALWSEVWARRSEWRDGFS